ncbi:MAG TPA: hypothetical protein VIF62_26090, partial [Labilithrix sp.]
MLGLLGWMGLACGPAAPPPALPRPPPPPEPIAIEEPAPPPPPNPGHWYFEWLSSDGRRALLRRVDPGARSSFDAKVVDVDTGETLGEASLDELGRVWRTGMGTNDADRARLDGLLATPTLGEELGRGADLTRPFPFGSCGRFSTAPSAPTVAFNAGDWLYVADVHGSARRRVTESPAYDPRFSPDGKFLFFRRVSGMIDKVVSKNEVYAVPADFSDAPRALAGTAGATGALVDVDGKMAVTLASHEPQIKTCALSIALKAPFAVKKLACFDGGEPLVEYVVSPHAKFAAVMTQKRSADGRLTWRVRVASLDKGKIILDEKADAGVSLRAISDAGMVVESNLDDEAVFIDAPAKKRQTRGDL